MKYNIISINDDRAEYKERIRARVGIEEVHIPAVNAHKVDLDAELQSRGLSVMSGIFSRGEIGVWLSTFDCWQWAVDHDEELVVFEDDAIPASNFDKQFRDLYMELPRDYGFLTLWVPDNQKLDYIYEADYSSGRLENVGPNRNAITSMYNFGAIRLARAYNGYGNVAQLYSPKGAAHLIEQARAKDIDTPVDCFVYLESHQGRVDGYAPKPNRAKVVLYDWKAETTVHGMDRV